MNPTILADRAQRSVLYGSRPERTNQAALGLRVFTESVRSVRKIPLREEARSVIASSSLLQVALTHRPEFARNSVARGCTLLACEPRQAARSKRFQTKPARAPHRTTRSNDSAECDERDGSDREPIPEHRPFEQLEVPAEHIDAPPRSPPNPCHREGDDFVHETKRYTRAGEVTIEGHSDDD